MNGCKIVKALLSLAVMMTVRYLGANGYGLLNNALGVAAFAAPR